MSHCKVTAITHWESPVYSTILLSLTPFLSIYFHPPPPFPSLDLLLRVFFFLSVPLCLHQILFRSRLRLDLSLDIDWPQAKLWLMLHAGFGLLTIPLHWLLSIHTHNLKCVAVIALAALSPKLYFFKKNDLKSQTPNFTLYLSKFWCVLVCPSYGRCCLVTCWQNRQNRKTKIYHSVEICFNLSELMIH